MTYPHPEPSPEGGNEPDLWDRVSVDAPRVVFGQLTMNLFECVLIKGQGKVPFDSYLHAGLRKNVAIEMRIVPIDPILPNMDRDTLEWAADWTGITRKSIEALEPQIARIKGLTVGQFRPAREINGMYVRAQVVPRPQNRKDQNFSCFEFLTVFQTPDECRAAHDAFQEENAPEPLSAQQPEDQKTVMARFLPPLWMKAGGEITGAMAEADLDVAKAKLDELIKASPLLAEHFTIESPEVVALWADIEAIPF